MITDREFLILRNYGAGIGSFTMIRQLFSLLLGRPLSDDETYDALARLAHDHGGLTEEIYRSDNPFNFKR